MVQVANKPEGGSLSLKEGRKINLKDAERFLSKGVFVKPVALEGKKMSYLFSNQGLIANCHR